MSANRIQKKRVVVSYNNISPELREEVKKKYPFGYTDHMLRIEKGQGDFFYAIVLEAEDTSYLIKVEVKIDDQIDEEEDKDYDNDEIDGADQIADSDEEEDE